MGEPVCNQDVEPWPEELRRQNARDAVFFSKPINEHLSYETVAARISEIEPKRVLLTHLNQDMLDRLTDVQFPVAEDGMTIELN